MMVISVGERMDVGLTAAEMEAERIVNTEPNIWRLDES